jgi:hypothetical protein
MIFRLISLEKVLQNRIFFALAPRSGFGAAICIAAEWLRRGSSLLRLRA